MHITKKALMERTKMSDLEAARWMNSLRNTTYANGGKVVRIIRNGVVTDQYVGGVPKYGK